MARTFVFSDNLAARAEILPFDEIDYGTWGYHCAGCAGPLADALQATEADSVEDAISAAEAHVDSCKHCADDRCRTSRPHDAGHRCRTF